MAGGTEETRFFELTLTGSGTSNAGATVHLEVWASGTGVWQTDNGMFDEFEAADGSVQVTVTDSAGTVLFDQTLDLGEFEVEQCETDPCEWELSGLDADNEFEVSGKEPETGTVTRTGPASFDVTGQGKLEDVHEDDFEASFGQVGGSVSIWS